MMKFFDQLATKLAAACLKWEIDERIRRVEEYDNWLAAKRKQEAFYRLTIDELKALRANLK